MAIEIERKFLLKHHDWRNAVERSERLAQAYLGGERASVRVRIGGAHAWLNIKSRERGVQRQEFEYAIPLADAEAMLDTLCMPGRIDKIRHHVMHAGRHWEIDEFSGANAGLIVAEIELDSADDRIDLPDWVGEEVSDDIRYYNATLAETPFSVWPPALRHAVVAGRNPSTW